MNYYARALRCIPGGVNSPVRAFRAVGGVPFFTTKADGALLTTSEGRQLIDFVCTWGPAIHGHNHPELRAALHEAVDRGTSFGTPHPGEVEMAEFLTSHISGLEQVRLVNSGTEATMSAIRLARGATGRDIIAKFHGCYHGHVDALLIKAGSGAITLGQPDSAGVPADFTRHTRILPYNDIDALEELFAREGDSLAAVILEPYPANIGLLLPQAGFLERLRALCTRHGTVLIFDEVMTGFRLALGGVAEVTGITPDLYAMGKIIGGGLPVGAFGGKAAIMADLAPLGPVYQAGTLSGNPLAVAAGLTSIRKLAEERPYDDLDQAGRALAEALRAEAARLGVPLQVIQTGSMFALFFRDAPVHNAEDATSGSREAFAQFFRAALARGVYLPPSPFETCFISTAHTPEVMARATEELCSALAEVAALD